MEVSGTHNQMESRLLTRLKRQEKERLFCVTGVKAVSSSLPSNGCRDTSSSSGYSSSADSSVEDKRLQVDQGKVFQVWEKLDSWRQTPRCSTPIRGCRRHRSVVEDSEKRRTNMSSNRSGSSKSSLLTTKKTIGEDKSRRTYMTLSGQDSAIVCDLSSRLVARHESECDLRRPRSAVRQKTHQDSEIRSKRRPICRLSGGFPRQRSPTTPTDALVIPQPSSRDGDSDRQSRSAQKVLMVGENNISDVRDLFLRQRSASLKKDSSKHLREVTNVRDDSVERKSGRGVSVDECMTDFLSNVNMENLVDFLNFYDKITSDSCRRSKCSLSGLGMIKDECNIYLRYI